MFLQLIGVILVVLGSSVYKPVQLNKHQTFNITIEHIMYILQFINAFTSAGGSIALRKMKSFHVAVISWYSDWSILLSSLAII